MTLHSPDVISFVCFTLTFFGISFGISFTLTLLSDTVFDACEGAVSALVTLMHTFEDALFPKPKETPIIKARAPRINVAERWTPPSLASGVRCPYCEDTRPRSGGTTCGCGATVFDNQSEPTKLNPQSFRNMTLVNTNLDGQDLRRADFRGAVVFNLSLRGCDLRGADFRGATLTGVNMKGARLDGTSFKDALMYNVLK